MANAREVVIVNGARTAIGDYGGSLKDIAPTDLGARVVREAVARVEASIPAQIGQCVFGNVIHTEAKDMYLSRVAAVNGGLPHESGALTLNRLCGSGLQAIVSASQYIMLGDIDAAVGGGAESMSRAAYANVDAALGRADGRQQDDRHDGRRADRPVRHDPHGRHGGERRDEVRHHARAAGRVRRREPSARDRRGDAKATSRSQILPIELKSKKGPVAVRHRRARARRRERRRHGEAQGGVRQGERHGDRRQRVRHQRCGGGRRADGGTGGAAREGLKPMARLVAYGHAGIDPKIMGLGPVSAVKARSKKAGLKIGDIDVIESNEAFAAQALGVNQQLDLDPAKVNPNGGAVALGHPIGATGCILTIKAMYELQRTGRRYGLITMCIGGGQGIAAIIERICSAPGSRP